MAATNFLCVLPLRGSLGIDTFDTTGRSSFVTNHNRRLGGRAQWKNQIENVGLLLNSVFQINYKISFSWWTDRLQGLDGLKTAFGALGRSDTFSFLLFVIALILRCYLLLMFCA